MSKYKLNHLYQNKTDKTSLYYISEWSSGEILVEEFKQVEDPYYSYVYEDTDFIVSLDDFENLIIEHVIDLGELESTDYSFKTVFNQIQQRHFGSNTDKVLVKDRTNDLIWELDHSNDIAKVDVFLSLAKKYHELIE